LSMGHALSLHSYLLCSGYAAESEMQGLISLVQVHHVRLCCHKAGDLKKVLFRSLLHNPLYFVSSNSSSKLSRHWKLAEVRPVPA